MQLYTITEARNELALHLGADAIEALMDTAQEYGQATIRDTDSHELTLIALDDEQGWGLLVANVVTAEIDPSQPATRSGDPDYSVNHVS